MAVGAIALASCGGGGPTSFRVTDAKQDVSITQCGSSTSHYAIASFRVTNRSSVESDYTTTVKFSAAGRTSTSGPGFERGVAAGKSVPGQVTGTRPVAATATVRCTVLRVIRTPSTVTTPTT